MTRPAITPQDRVNLSYAAEANRHGLGLFGPTVRRCGKLPEMRPLVSAGLVEYRQGWGHRLNRGGYWITYEGRRALEATIERIPS